MAENLLGLLSAIFEGIGSGNRLLACFICVNYSSLCFFHHHVACSLFGLSKLSKLLFYYQSISRAEIKQLVGRSGYSLNATICATKYVIVAGPGNPTTSQLHPIFKLNFVTPMKPSSTSAARMLTDFWTSFIYVFVFVCFCVLFWHEEKFVTSSLIFPICWDHNSRSTDETTWVLFANDPLGWNARH